MKFKAIITDLDGTAVDAPAQRMASPRLKASVAKLHDQGVKVSAATGRSVGFAESMFTSMGLKDPAIVSGGSLIVDPVTKEELWSCKIGVQTMEKIIALLAPRGYTNYFWNNYDEHVYWDGGWTLEDFSQMSDTYFFGILAVPEPEVEELKRLIEQSGNVSVVVVTGQQEGAREFHITHKEATKEHAIYELEKILGVTRQDTIGVGDGHNDIHLFSAVGYKVAMGNAVPELKESADQIIGSVKEDGLAEYFEGLAREENYEI